eukprot:scaffold4428_cov57-Cyclotella_meneghiniana.AAC.3
MPEAAICFGWLGVDASLIPPSSTSHFHLNSDKQSRRLLMSKSTRSSRRQPHLGSCRLMTNSIGRIEICMVHISVGD